VNCTSLAAKLPGLAANFTASANIYKKLPPSHLHEWLQKNAENAPKPPISYFALYFPWRQLFFRA